ncbi:DUF362 domain-containing protein [Candidatus Bathyarchaeota archaeon]|nr:DUF362 domain-containing protein [Candidatus Bathyarchaeota archaeon]
MSISLVPARMVWFCPNCSLEWSYPVKYCTNCRKETGKKDSSRYVVVGFTQISIPSPKNETVPYYVVLLEGDSGGRILKKTFKEPRLGDEFREVLSGGRTLVSVSRVKYDISGSVAKVLNLLGDVKINETQKVLIKPNLSFPANASSGVVTNPLVVEGVIEYLLSNGARREDILVGDSCAIGFDMNSILRKSGLGEVCERMGVEFIDLEECGTVLREIEISGEKFRIEFADEVFKRDLIVNLPVVKTHFQAGVSLALKNMKGCAKSQSKKYMHRFGLQKAIAYMNLLLPKYVTVADGTVGLEGFGPSVLGRPADLGLIFAGKDPVALDLTVCRLLGLESTEYMRLASRIGVGNGDLDSVSVVGEEYQAVTRRLERPAQEFSPTERIRVIDGNGCSGCSNNLWVALSRLPKDTGSLEAEVVFGSYFGPDRLDSLKLKFAVGDCAIVRMREIGLEGQGISGCPPETEAILRRLSEWYFHRRGHVAGTWSTNSLLRHPL